MKQIRKRSRKQTPERSGQIAAPTGLFERVASILDGAQARVVRAINSEMVLACWHIGREIAVADAIRDLDGLRASPSSFGRSVSRWTIGTEPVRCRH